MQKQEITIYDVAREAKVSMATVSRVVNGNNNVRKETRDRVLAVIDRLHYQPNAVAQGLASKKTTTVGLIVPGFTNLHFAELSQGIDDIATMYKYNILLSSVGNKLLEDDQVVQSLLNKQVDGVIYMSNQMSDKAREALSRNNTPVVLAGTLDSSETFGSVAIDFDKAEEEVIKLFYKDGKKNIALVLNNKDSYINKEVRIPAYKRVVTENNAQVHVYSGVATYEDGVNIYQQLKQDKIDAVIATGDMPAAGIINAAVEDQVSIPEQLEIVSAASTNIADIVRPKMTTVRQPLYDIGAVAMRMLTKMMNNEEVEDLHIVLPFEIKPAATTINK